MSCKLFVCRNFSVTSPPNKYPAPRGDNPHPNISSGSDHSKSHIAPSVNSQNKVFKSAFTVRDFLLSVDRANLVKSIYGWRESTVDTKYLVINDCREGEIIKYLAAVPPHIDTPKLSQTLVVEAVHLALVTTNL